MTGPTSDPRDSTVSRLVLLMAPTVAEVVDRWTAADIDVLRTDWATFLLSALQHRVEGLATDALRALGWHEIVPPSVFHTIERRGMLAEARFQAHHCALQELRDADEELVASLILLKGAVLVGEYAMTCHRMVGDFDVLVEVELADRLAARTAELGYWEKTGKNGPTYFKDIEGGIPGSGYVGLDVHYVVPTKYHRDEGTLHPEHWSSNAEPFDLGGVVARRAPRALEMVNLLVHLHEHAASWLHWTLEDDVRLIRVLDIELLATLDGVDAAAVLAHARALGVVAELALGLALVEGIRGELPIPLAPLEPYAGCVRPYIDLLALPTGELLTMTDPIATRIFRTDKAAQALMLVGDLASRHHWFDWKRGLLRGHEPVAEIAQRAKVQLASEGFDA